MNDRNSYIASTLPTEELKVRIENRPEYLPQTTEASIAELKARGIEFTQEELDTIADDLEAQRANALLPVRAHLMSKISYKNNVVKDPAAPGLYSRRAIYFFTIFFGAFFGGIMLVMNMVQLKNYKNIPWVILFGITLTVIPFYVAEYANAGSSPGLFFGLISAACIDYFFWDKFIGPVFYRTRNLWGPSIIAALFLALVFLATFYGDTALDADVR